MQIFSAPRCLCRENCHLIKPMTETTLGILWTVGTRRFSEYKDVLEKNVIHDYLFRLLLNNQTSKTLSIVDKSHVSEDKLSIRVSKCSLIVAFVCVEIAEFSTFLAICFNEIEAMTGIKTLYRVSNIATLSSTIVSTIVTMSNESSIYNTSSDVVCEGNRLTWS